MIATVFLDVSHFVLFGSEKRFPKRNLFLPSYEKAGSAVKRRLGWLRFSVPFLSCKANGITKKGHDAHPPNMEALSQNDSPPKSLRPSAKAIPSLWVQLPDKGTTSCACAGLRPWLALLVGWSSSKGRFDTGFFGFPEMVPKFQVATACFSCSPPNFKLIKITPCCGCRRFNCFLNYR
jgi:hypothetical protein